MENKLTQEERKKIKHFFYICKLKHLVFGNLWPIMKFIVFIGIYGNLLRMNFDSLIPFIIAVVLYSLAYFVALLIMKLYLVIASKRYDSLEINRITHKIGGTFVAKNSSAIISSYKNDFNKIRNDFNKKSVKTTTHTIIINNFIKALAPNNNTANHICHELINATKNPDLPFSKKYTFAGQYEITINRSKKGKQKNGVDHNSLRIIKYIKVPFRKMTDSDLKDLYKLDTFYDLNIKFL